MIKTAKLMTLASVIGLLSALPAAAWSDSINSTTHGRAALRTPFHSAAFNVVDDLSDYGEDLSAHGTPQRTGGVNKQIQLEPTPVNETATVELDLVALRAFFHSAAFNVIDDLGTYNEDLSDVVTTDGHTVAQLPQ